MSRPKSRRLLTGSLSATCLKSPEFSITAHVEPGVVQAKVGRNDLGQFSVNGQRADANYFTVDGQRQYGHFRHIQSGPDAGRLVAGTHGFWWHNLVSVDALEEFKVMTSSYAAEFGRSPGAQVLLVTRSGGNDFNGAFFDYVRNDIFDANDWFTNRNRGAKPPLRQNDFGVSFMGQFC